MRIALDAMGSDRGPAEMVAGAALAVRVTDVHITIVGGEEQIIPALKKEGISHLVDFVPTSQVITMHDSPIEAVRKKKDSSVVVAFELLRKHEVDAVVSPGNSGAVMAAAIKFLGRLKDISRPGIASVFPTLKGPVVVMDVGANVDCRPKHLLQFGVMASAFSRIMYGIEKPRVGLLSIGEEGGKGNALVKSAHSLFQSSGLNYIGNVEGRDTFVGDVDVIVCDGFVGNVCLKLSEGLAEAVLSMLREEICKTFKARMGYFLAKQAFSNFKKRVDYAEYGGAPLLGFNGTGVICHGRSNMVAIKNALLVADGLAKNNVNDHILAMLETTKPALSHFDESDVPAGAA
ncbi:MAG: phosphate acyltransferase PlsX [Proteobacteria bacterium]|nr:phosphate acyltransferase PlsX [Pseudomonadota bacterium]MBU4297528.1 phosphate acyltransferase PlsX [Pseudomonadota bacterium]MCG2749746.1 phosphate acyltransferase PlsX [Desulfobulbaceae bacterium]